jgi:hypothetical protein
LLGESDDFFAKVNLFVTPCKVQVGRLFLRRLRTGICDAFLCG